MTQQEYEQKRAECWEEFIHSVKGITTAYEEDIAKKAIGYAFDRAYALGKQTETVTREEIEKAADEYAKDAYYPAPDYGWYESDDEQMREVLENTFKAGAQFALGKQEKDAEDTVIQGWVARDDGERWHERELHLFTRNKPERRKLMGDWSGYRSMTLDSNLFPDLTWDDDPQEVEIIIKRKKK